MNLFKEPTPYHVLPGVALYSLANGLTFANTLYVFRDIACRSYYRSHPIPGPATVEVLCSVAPVEARTSSILSGWILVDAICTIVFVRVLSRLISSRGRKFGMAICGLSTAVASICLAIAAASKGSMSIAFVFAALLTSTPGNQSVLELAAQNYIVDLVEPSRRNSYFTMLYSVFLGSVGLGTAAGGWISLHIHQQAPYWISACLGLIFFLYARLLMPESLTAARRNTLVAESIANDAGGDTDSISNVDAISIIQRKSAFRRFISAINFFKLLTIYNPGRHRTTTGRKNWRLTSSGLSLFLIFFAASFSTPLIMLTMIGRLKFNQQDSGFGLTILVVAKAAFCGLVLPPVTSTGHDWYSQRVESDSESKPLLHARGSNKPLAAKTVESQSSKFDLHFTLLSGMMELACYGAMAFASSTKQLVVVLVLATLASGTTPSAKAYATSLVAFSETDHLIGSFALIQGVAALLSPLIMGSIYAATIETAPYIAFFGIGICYFLGGFLPFVISQVSRR